MYYWKPGCHLYSRQIRHQTCHYTLTAHTGTTLPYNNSKHTSNIPEVCWCTWWGGWEDEHYLIYCLDEEWVQLPLAVWQTLADKNIILLHKLVWSHYSHVSIDVQGIRSYRVLTLREPPSHHYVIFAPMAQENRRGKLYTCILYKWERMMLRWLLLHIINSYK